MPLQLQSLIRADGVLEVSLQDVPMPEPATPDEVVIQVEAAPINPSDLGWMFAGVDMRQAQVSGTPERPVLSAAVPPAALAALAGRIGQPLPLGNEGAGTVVAAGRAPAAQALLGRRVAALGGGMYAQYRALPAQQCLLLPAGVSAAQGASSFINPLTALGMVDTARREGHSALVHTVGASNLGQMLNRLCLQEHITLVNLVRRPEQVELLRRQGAQHVLDRSAPGYAEQLIDTLAATGARLAFDATGGGKLAGELIAAMEAALLRKPGQPYDRYGSQVHKQIYIYGYLERGPIELPPGLAMAWSVGGWLLFSYLRQIGPERLAQLKQQVAQGLDTVFASHYAQTFTLAQALTPEAVTAYTRLGSGEKALLEITPPAAA